MPVAIPVIAAFATAIATPTFLTIAGAALVGIGAVTGKKDLVKIGSLMSLGGSLISGFASASGSASSSAASEAAAEQAAQEGFRSLEYADKAAYAGEAAGNASVTPATAGMDQATNSAASAGVDASTIDPLERANQFYEAGESNASIFDKATAASNGAPSTATAEGGSILDKLSAAQEPGTSVLADVNRQALQIGVQPSASVPTGVTINGQVMPVDRIADYARATPASQIQATNASSTARAATNLGTGGKLSIGDVGDWLGTKVGEIGQWVERNPNVALVGGKMLAGALGPDAEAVDLQRSIYERRRANLNAPVALTFGKT